MPCFTSVTSLAKKMDSNTSNDSKVFVKLQMQAPGHTSVQQVGDVLPLLAHRQARAAGPPGRLAARCHRHGLAARAGGRRASARRVLQIGKEKTFAERCTGFSSYGRVPCSNQHIYDWRQHLSLRLFSHMLPYKRRKCDLCTRCRRTAGMLQAQQIN